MIAKCILDTDILSECLKGHDPVVVTKASQYVREHGALSFTAVTVHEIIYGLELKDAHGQLRRVRAWLEQNRAITPITDDYIAAAVMRATARKQGFLVELPDLLSPRSQFGTGGLS